MLSARKSDLQVVSRLSSDGNLVWSRQIVTPVGTYVRIDSFTDAGSRGIFVQGEIVDSRTGRASMGVFLFSQDGQLLGNFAFAPPFYAEAMGRPYVKNQSVYLTAYVADAFRNFTFGYRFEWQRPCAYCGTLQLTAQSVDVAIEAGPLAQAGSLFGLSPQQGFIVERVPRAKLIEPGTH